MEVQEEEIMAEDDSFGPMALTKLEVQYQTVFLY
jgi:hypothetical protein